MALDQKKIDKVLTLLFYLLALAALLLYFFSEDRATDRLWMYLGFSAIGVRIVSYIMRFLL